MPIRENREYRSMPLMKAANGEKLIESDFYVEGYATTFNQPYLLWEDDDGSKYYEEVSDRAFDGADVSDVIFLRNHEGKCLARNKMKAGKDPTLVLKPDNVGLFIGADLGITEEGRDEYRAITGGLVYQMSFAFTVADDEINEVEPNVFIRRIKQFKKIYDVSSVDTPANPYTSVNTIARSSFDGYIEQKKQEMQRAEERKRQIQRIRILTEVTK